MSFQLIVAIGFILLIFVIFGLGIYWAVRHGRDDERKKQAEEDLNNVSDRLQKHREPILSDADYRDRLRRAQERYRRLRDRAAERKDDA